MSTAASSKSFFDITYSDLKNTAIYESLKPGLLSEVVRSRNEWLQCKHIAEGLLTAYAAAQVSMDPAVQAEAQETKRCLDEARAMVQILKGRFETEQRMVEEYNAFGMCWERAILGLSDHDEMVVRAEASWIDFQAVRDEWRRWLDAEIIAREVRRRDGN